MFNKKTKIILFILLFILTILLRYPIIPHELGTDSFVNHMVINFISDSGGPVWIKHPLELFGFGETLNMEIFISAISQIIGLDIEKSILYYSLIISILGITGFFILVYSVTKDFLIAYLSSLLFSIAPEFIRLTVWTASSRSFLIAFLPIFLYFLFRSINTKDMYRNILFTLILLILLMGAHDLIFFVFFMVFALILSVIFTTKIKINISINEKQLNFIYIFILLISTFLSAILLRLGPYESNPNLWSKYTEGFLSGEDIKTVFINMVINYIDKIGFLLIIVFIGIIFLFKKTKLSLFDKFCLTTILIMSPLFGVGVYVPVILMCPLLYIISHGIIELNNYLSTKYINRIKIPNNLIFTFLFVCAVTFSIFMNFNWAVWNAEPIDDIAYSKETSNFMKEYGNGTYIPNERSLAYRWTAYSDVLFKPYNKPVKNNVQYTPYLDFDTSLIKGGKPLDMIKYKRIEPINNQTNSTGQRNSTGEEISGEFWYAVTKVWDRKVNEQKSYFDKNNVKYTIETRIVQYSNEVINKFSLFKDVHSNKQKIYDAGVEEMWYVW